MSRMPRIVSTISVVVGAIALVVGVSVYFTVRSQLSAQHITVSSDASMMAGQPVTGPFTAYAQAEVLNTHALEAGNGKTYAELPQGDPARNTVMTANFLQASLYTSVVAFGLSFLIAALGIMFILLGLGFRVLDKRTTAVAAQADLVLDDTTAPATGAPATRTSPAHT
jgi:hypothetical protein